MSREERLFSEGRRGACVRYLLAWSVVVELKAETMNFFMTIG
jgi:hypothetical protein